MSTAIGQELLDNLITDLGLEGISTGLEAALAVRFGQMYEAGFWNDNQLAAVLWAVPASKASLEAAGIETLLDAGVDLNFLLLETDPIVLTGKSCRQPAMANGRCPLYGGLSTGPTETDLMLE
jgi:hypothetical protein